MVSTICSNLLFLQDVCLNSIPVGGKNPALRALEERMQFVRSLVEFSTTVDTAEIRLEMLSDAIRDRVAGQVLSLDALRVRERVGKHSVRTGYYGCNSAVFLVNFGDNEAILKVLDKRCTDFLVNASLAADIIALPVRQTARRRYKRPPPGYR